MLEKFSKWKQVFTTTEGKTLELNLDPTNIPKHVAIIMDGNGRWAAERGLPRIAGHREGVKNVNKIVRASNALNVEVLTLYAFSTENWKRPKAEVDFLLKLPERYLKTELPTLIKENVQVRLMGTKDQLPSYTLGAFEEAIEKTKNNTGLILNFAMNYGSRFEMSQAMQAIAEKVKAGELQPDEINEDLIGAHLMSGQLRDPDLLIRTSGEIRLSNFMLWQLAYSEFWFTDVLWPNFSEAHFHEAIATYQNRGRRYGGL
ncbi:undecaprenyl diphosphate synthase [Bacillus sp. JCM 19046]|uniref:Isoprenyl transferase n=1 Tax=Shouchella xiaoxiensis TaxID=766895 RepID=A0ABS2SQ76_9BACI|nr:isoprenyl transferase [Shouchella xiaoxiensis]MBM7837678.1 undecaprenyl diphosphate synthase [Shouchella xiaoxiensis]GAF12909.1 undecaprenyl diphosphate synthase [Bacillus sp. JCM 19045]GAF16721.1 undecaprenyl diphosphate synthase [Bacillus sp. JCM 19046]